MKRHFSAGYFIFIMIIFVQKTIACDVPSGIMANAVTTSSISLSWNEVPGATSYKVQYRQQGAATWIIKTTTVNSVTLSDLEIGTVYETGVRSFCGAEKSTYSITQTFETLLPTPDHIVICMMENKAYDQIVGSSLASFINSLVADSNSVLFTQSYALTHPSQPNYLHLYSGSDQGVTSSNCNTTFFTTDNLGSQLIASGKSYTTYSEDLPSVGFDGCAYGKYVRRHNPAANWMGTGTNQVPSTTNQPFDAFPSDYSALPAVCMVIPNLDNDMHSGGIKQGDLWLQANLDPYIQWAKTHNSLFILTWDEDDDSSGNHIVTIFTGAMVKHGQDSTIVNHHTILRTLEDMYSLSYAGGAAAVANISGCWKATGSSCSYTSIPAKPAAISGPTLNVCGSFSYSFTCPTVLNATSYNWTLPAGSIINSGQGTTNITATMPSGFQSGIISVNASNCFGTSDNRSITVYGIPKKPGMISGPATVCANQINVNYSISAVAGATSYKWKVPAGASIVSGQGTTSMTVNYGASGGKVEVQSKSSCGSSAFKALAVSVTCRASEIVLVPFTVYPNPSSGEFHCQFNYKDDEWAICVKDVSGRIVSELKKFNSGVLTFGKELPAGIYFLEATNKEGERQMMKVVKQMP